METQIVKLVPGDKRSIFDAAMNVAETRITELEMKLAAAELNLRYAEQIIQLAAMKMGGTVRGVPTNEHNFLLRIEQLIDKEVIRDVR